MCQPDSIWKTSGKIDQMSQLVDFNKPVREIIQNRISIRSYEPRDMPDEIIENINNFSAHISFLFNTQIRVKIVHVPAMEKDTKLKLGTYGVIHGTNYFIAAIINDSKLSLVNAGYVLEHVVLYAASLGLGTCWLAGTFNRSAFSQALEMKKGEVLPAIIALGYPQKARLHLIDSIFRKVAKSRTRKSWDQIFFNENFQTPLTHADAGQYAEAFEMLRWAPSASNKQPWRLLKQTNKIHFYIHRPVSGHGTTPFYNLPFVDLGIGMSHFELIANENGLTGSWGFEAPDIIDISNELTYLTTWTRNL